MGYGDHGLADDTPMESALDRGANQSMIHRSVTLLHGSVRILQPTHSSITLSASLTGITTLKQTRVVGQPTTEFCASSLLLPSIGVREFGFVPPVVPSDSAVCHRHRRRRSAAMRRDDNGRRRVDRLIGTDQTFNETRPETRRNQPFVSLWATNHTQTNRVLTFAEPNFVMQTDPPQHESAGEDSSKRAGIGVQMGEW